MSHNPLFAISLDFELYWGMFDKVSLAEYGDNIKGAHTAIPEMLALFKKHDIHATWATVGMLMSTNKEGLIQHLPSKELQPHYSNMEASAYVHITTHSIKENESTDPYHFGQSLVEEIIHAPHQELGSHTFSHYYCLDGEENDDAVFNADCEAFTKAAEPFSQKITSIVFPRNQTTTRALHTCADYGFTAYRGTPTHFLYTGKKEREQTNPLLRILRLLDTYINISGHHTYPIRAVNSSINNNKERYPLNNVQGSWFLRPYSYSLRLFESLKIRRIKKSMTYAAVHNEVFHLWWHPHNFGINRKQNLQNLLSIIVHFHYLKEKYGMQSATMNEVAILANESAV